MSTALTTGHQQLSVVSQPEQSFESLIIMGDALQKTGFLPSHIRNGVSFAAIVLMGRELGMGTMAACRKLQVIKGTVTERADSQLARFKSCGGKSQFQKLTATEAVIWLRHPNGAEHTETFTFEDAKRAGLASNDNYAKHPKAMLRSRAITAGLKSIGWEGAVGIYDPDEITDTESPATVERAHAPATAVKAQPPALSAFDRAAKLIGEAVAFDGVQGLDRYRKAAADALAEGRLSQDQHDQLLRLIEDRAEELIGTDSGVGFPAESAETEAHA